MKYNNTPGYVYILTNPSFREDWVKIGKTIDLRGRLKTLDNTSVPLPFEIFATMKTSKYNEAEHLVHKYIERFTNLRIRDKREFFNVKPEEALEILRDVAEVLDDAEIDEFYKHGFEEDREKEQKENKRIKGENRVWLIPYNKKFFDLEGCFKKYGEVYWTQFYNFRKGDTGYIYGSSPESAIRYSFEVVDADLHHSSDMDREKDYNLVANDSHNGHDRFALLKYTGKTNNPRLGLAHLLSHGMKIAPRGALNLSYKDYAELKKYIEENF